MRNALMVAAALAALAGCTRSDDLGKAAEGNCGVPAAPQGLRGSPGPGPAQASIAWDEAAANGGAPVSRYVVYRDGEAFAHLGNSLAYGDTGATGGHDYAVSAINTCGTEGPQSSAVNVTALPGALVDAPVADAPDAAQARLIKYRVLGPEGEDRGYRAWRVVTGLGNCCETYVGSDAAGTLYEYGGSILYQSKDEGQTWQSVSNVAPAVGAEGAIVGAPGGDMLAVNWDPYTGDQLWSHKYVAATGKWYTARSPIHQPAYDRPWVAVVEGPFEVQGLIVPYVSFLMSNYVHGDVLLMSLDGLHYVVPTLRELAEGLTPVPLALLPPDPSRDWNQSIQQTSIYPIDNGIGLRDRNLTGGCAHAVFNPLAEWTCPDWMDAVLAPEAGDVIRVDSSGAIHVTRVDGGSPEVEHRVSIDGGRTWKVARARLPGRRLVEEWDVQVNSALDQVVVVVHGSITTDHKNPDQDMVLRFTDIRGDFRLKEVLLVGDGDHPFGSSLGASGDRFDYTTVALLPTGHVALSFGDRRHVPPAIAIETDVDPEGVDTR